jgi:hypothetical protein
MRNEGYGTHDHPVIDGGNTYLPTPPNQSVQAFLDGYHCLAKSVFCTDTVRQFRSHLHPEFIR